MSRLNIKPYDAFFYKACRYNPIFSALQYYRINVEPFFANDIFLYKYDCGDCMPRSECMMVEHECIIFDKLGIQFEPCELLSISFIESSIKEDIPVLISIDKFYWNDLKWNTLWYNKKHLRHFFLIIGIDAITKVVDIIDVFDNGKDFYCFCNTIEYGLLEKCYQGVEEVYGKEKQELSRIIHNGNAVYKPNYYSVFCRNMNTYKEKIGKSREAIIECKQFYQENEADHFQIFEAVKKSLGTCFNCAHKRVQAYEYSFFWGEDEIISKTIKNSHDANYLLICLLRKTAIEGKADYEIVKKIEGQLDNIYNNETLLYNRIRDKLLEEEKCSN